VKFVKVLLAVSVAANVWMLYHLLDVGVTTTYMSSSIEAKGRSAENCLQVLRLDWLGRREAEVIALPERLKARGLPAVDLYLKREGNVVSVLDLSFRLVGGKVSEVSYYGSIDLTPGGGGSK